MLAPSLLAIPATVVVVAAWLWWVVRGPATVRVRALRALPAVGVALGLPWWLPPEWTEARAVISALAIVLAMKSLELASGRLSDPTIAVRFPRFALWLFVPPDLRFPDSEPARATIRRKGARTLLRLFGKIAAIVGLLALATFVPEVHAHRIASDLWGLWMIYFAISAISDAVLSVVMLGGVDVAQVFDVPPLSRSPREFWSRRWNRFVHTLGFRHLFLPLGGRRHPLFATAAVFVVSGIGHEYLVVGALGSETPFGLMTSFFAVHGLATVVQMAVESRLGRRRVLPRPLAIAAFLGFLLATAPLFLVPLEAIFGYTGWRL